MWNQWQRKLIYPPLIQAKRGAAKKTVAAAAVANSDSAVLALDMLSWMMVSFEDDPVRYA